MTTKTIKIIVIFLSIIYVIPLQHFVSFLNGIFSLFLLLKRKKNYQVNMFLVFTIIIHHIFRYCFTRVLTHLVVTSHAFMNLGSETP